MKVDKGVAEPVAMGVAVKVDVFETAGGSGWVVGLFFLQAFNEKVTTNKIKRNKRP